MFGKKKKGSKILKLPPVRNCFTLAVTNKLVVIINSLKVPKIKTILLYEMKFLVRNYSCLQIPRLWGYRPQIPVLCPQLNLLNPPPQTKFLGTPLLAPPRGPFHSDLSTKTLHMLPSALEKNKLVLLGTCSPYRQVKTKSNLLNYYTNHCTYTDL